MARLRTLSDMISDCRLRAQMVNDEFVTDPEITEYLNQELAFLWTELVLNQGQPFYRSSTTINVVPGTTLYVLPADFFTLQQVEAEVNGYSGCLRPFMPNERAWLNNNQYWNDTPVRYRIQAANLEFIPSTWTFTATVYYSPSQPRLTLLSDTFDGFNGFETAAINGTVATMLAKESSDNQFWLDRRAETYAQIKSIAGSRDMSNPERVQDVMGADDVWLLPPGAWY